MRFDPRVTGALVLAAAIFGFNAVAIKDALRSTDTLTLLVVRSVVASAFMALWLRRAGVPVLAIPRGSGLRVVAAAAVMAVSQLTFVLAIFHLAAGLVTMLTAAQPVVAMAIAWLLVRERVGPLGVLGAVIGAGGVVLAVSATGAGGGDPWGVAILFFSNALFAVASVMVKGLEIPHPGARFLIWSGALAGIGALPFAIWHEDFAIDWSWRFAASAGYSALIGSAVGLLLLTFVLRSAPVFVTSLVTLLSPVFGISAAALVLGEPVSWRQVLGGLVIVAGVSLAVRQRPGSLAAPPVGRAASSGWRRRAARVRRPRR